MRSETQAKWSSVKLRLTSHRTMPGKVKRVGAEALMGKPSKAPEPNWLQAGVCILCFACRLCTYRCACYIYTTLWGPIDTSSSIESCVRMSVCALCVSCMTYYVIVFWPKHSMTATRRAFSSRSALAPNSQRSCLSRLVRSSLNIGRARLIVPLT